MSCPLMLPLKRNAPYHVMTQHQSVHEHYMSL